MIVTLVENAIYFNTETQRRRVRRGSLRSGVRSQGLDSGVSGGAKVRASGYGVFAEVPRGGASGRRQRAKLWRRGEVGGESGVRFWHLMQSPVCVARTAKFTWATESEASALVIFRKAEHGRERCPKTHPARAASATFYRP